MATAVQTDFLPLEYTRHHYGKPLEAESGTIPHHWNDHDYAYIAAEFSIEAGRDELINDFDVFYVWVRDISRSLFNNPDKIETVTWWQSPRFHHFEDAEAFAQFAHQRWQATGRFSAAGMEWRDDLDARRNPID